MGSKLPITAILAWYRSLASAARPAAYAESLPGSEDRALARPAIPLDFSESTVESQEPQVPQQTTSLLHQQKFLLEEGHEVESQLVTCSPRDSAA